MNDNNKNLTMEIESEVFRTLIKHLQNKTEVQNIDLMNLADFCRNCLSKWYIAAAKNKESLIYSTRIEIVLEIETFTKTHRALN